MAAVGAGAHGTRAMWPQRLTPPRAACYASGAIKSALRPSHLAPRAPAPLTLAPRAPQYHDMGLINGCLLAAMSGWRAELMSPHTFLKKPITWLQARRQPDAHARESTTTASAAAATATDAAIHNRPLRATLRCHEYLCRLLSHPSTCACTGLLASAGTRLFRLLAQFWLPALRQEDQARRARSTLPL